MKKKSNSTTTLHNAKKVSSLSKSFEDLLTVIKKLRSPEGCPWDREQNLYTLKEHIIEEVYELVDALDKRDIENIKEELGDLLLHVIFHAVIGEEENLFAIYDIFEALKEKLIRRHPHVFSNITVKDSKEVLINWEKLKKQEKNNRTSIFDGIPEGLPSIHKAYKLQEKAKKIGLDWPSTEACLKKLDEELYELKDAIEKKDSICLEHEIGDMLFTIINLSRFLNVNADESLRQANIRFRRRAEYVEKNIENNAESFKEKDPALLDKLWNLSKKHTK
jgi:tetrapyrrole methylase family protein/MazG family protein